MEDDGQQRTGRDIAQTREVGVPGEQVIDQRTVPFLDDELRAALTSGGSIYISLPGMCRALGLNTQAQLRRIMRTPSLLNALRIMSLETRGGAQQVNCLRVDKVALWLAGVETLSVKPAFRAKIEAYQEELAPVAMQVFLRMAGITTAQLVPASADPQAPILAEQIDSLLDVLTFLREHLAAVLSLPGQVEGIALQLGQAITLLGSLAERQSSTETQLARIDARTQRLTPAHAREVQTMVDRIVRETKRLPIPLTYATIYGRLKHRFRVGSYSEVPDGKFDELIAYLGNELQQATSGAAPEQGSLF